jgi:hypothetical protein
MPPGWGFDLGHTAQEASVPVTRDRFGNPVAGQGGAGGREPPKNGGGDEKANGDLCGRKCVQGTACKDLVCPLCAPVEGTLEWKCQQDTSFVRSLITSMTGGGAGGEEKVEKLALKPDQ